MRSDKVELTVKATVQAPVEKVWECWTDPKHIVKWNHASDDWHSPYAQNDLRVGGNFLSRMEAKDESYGFDFTGVYDQVQPYKAISYVMGDGRKVKTVFNGQGNTTEITETFDAESVYPIEQQQSGWQAILDNFKKYTEQPG
jgi:uncharacterized protein YndB with AHSA1/START domain